MMNIDISHILTHLALRSRYVLDTNVLPFWKQHLYDETNGRFYSYVDQNKKPDPTKPLNAILLSRMLWAYSAVFEEYKDPESLHLAHAAYDVLLSSFKDPLYDGIFSQIRADYTPLILQKRTFAQAFYVIALARYARATGKKDALKEARQVHALLLEHAQPERGGFTDTLCRDWSDDTDEHIWWMNREGASYIFNSQLHMLEAAIELQQLDPSEAGLIQMRAQIAFILNFFLNQDKKHLCVSMTSNHKPMDTTIVFSNELEAAYLLRRAAHLTGEQADIDDLCTALVRNSMSIGLDKIHKGFFFSAQENLSLNRCKVWYVQAEAMIALLDAFEHTKSNDFLDQAIELWQYIEQHLIDWNKGEWFASAVNPYLDALSIQQQQARDQRTGTEKASAYKCPYHTVRACIEMEKRAKHLLRLSP
ncbi:MAG: hypothetical protein EOM15_12635 [Spirochaetia bacterium]|nr:hypothetical protein [Spirochaetia bacterium]